MGTGISPWKPGTSDIVFWEVLAQLQHPVTKTDCFCDWNSPVFNFLFYHVWLWGSGWFLVWGFFSLHTLKTLNEKLLLEMLAYCWLICCRAIYCVRRSYTTLQYPAFLLINPWFHLPTNRNCCLWYLKLTSLVRWKVRQLQQDFLFEWFVIFFFVQYQPIKNSNQILLPMEEMPVM